MRKTERNLKRPRSESWPGQIGNQNYLNKEMNECAGTNRYVCDGCGKEKNKEELSLYFGDYFCSKCYKKRKRNLFWRYGVRISDNCISYDPCDKILKFIYIITGPIIVLWLLAAFASIYFNFIQIT